MGGSELIRSRLKVNERSMLKTGVTVDNSNHPILKNKDEIMLVSCQSALLS